jgi:hypothetical protein
MIDEGLADAQRQYSLLLQAKHVPYVLDDHAVERTIKVYGQALEDIALFDEQLRRWRRKPLTPAQRREVDRLVVQLLRFREVVEDIVSVAEELKGLTIEALLAKSDLEIGMEAIFGGRIVTDRRAGPPAAESSSEQGGVLALPEGVSLARITHPSGAVGYAIGHVALGEVGRIVLTDVAGGHCRIDAEVAGSGSDPGFDLRRELLSKVFAELDRVLSAAGVGPP